MRQFGFKHPEFLKLPRGIREFMISNYHKPLSEDIYVGFIRGFYGDRQDAVACKYRRKPYLRRQYRRLNKKYNFFEEVKNV